jgi:hypothetical protein
MCSTYVILDTFYYLLHSYKNPDDEPKPLPPLAHEYSSTRLDSRLREGDIVSLRVSSDFDETGTFSASHKRVTKLTF